MRNSSKSPGPLPVPYSLEGDVAPPHTYYYPDYAVASGEEEGPDFQRVGKLLWSRKWWIVGAAIVGSAVGYGASSFVTPEYSSTTRLSIQDQGPARTGPIQTGPVLSTDGWTDVFQSRAVLLPVVDSLGLHLRVDDPDHRPLFRSFQADEGRVPGLYRLSVGEGSSWQLEREGEGSPVERGAAGDVIGAAAGFTWSPDLSGIEPGTEIEFSLLSSQNAARDLGQRLNVNYRNRSDIIAATLTWHDPNEGAEILNALATRFVWLADQIKSTKIREEVEMLQTQSDLTGEQLANAEYALENQRVESITEPTEPMISPTEGTGGVGGQDPIFGSYGQNKVQADQLEADLRQIRQIQSSLASGQPLNLLAVQYIPAAQQSAELSQAVTALQNARIDRRTLMYTYTEEEPSVVAATQRIQELEQQIIPEALRRLEAGIENQLDVLRGQISSQENQLREIPQRSIRQARLQREVQHAAGLHATLLGRLKEAELAAATAGPGIEIIDPAWPNPTPQGEGPGRIIALFSLLSLGLGIAGVIVFDRFDRRIHSPDQVTGSLGLPVLAVVPRLQAAPDPASPAAAIAVESFRGLRTQIAHVDGNIGGVTLITSPAPREGKSMVSANLAISYATAGYRTVLLDGDTRRGRAQEMFNLHRSPGLTDYLMKRASLEDVLQDTSVDNLELIARGAPGGFNADLLEGELMVTLLDKLREDYDVVVIDGPPLAAGADVLMLGSQVDKVVIVLRAGATTEDLARAKLETLGNVDLPIVGAVLNALPKTAPDYEYYVHYYYADAEAS